MGGKDVHADSCSTVRDGSRPDESIPPSRDGKLDDTIDQELIDELRAFEENTITRTGTVLGGFVADFAAEATASDVHSAVEAIIADARSVPTDEAWSLITDSSAQLLSREYAGLQVFVLVELPSGDVFVDRFTVPERDDVETTETRRYDGFVAEHGDLELISQLEGDRVDVAYSATESRWVLDLDDGLDAPIGNRRPSFPLVRRGSVYAVLSGAFVYGWIQLAGVPSSPTIGAISPHSVLTASIVILLVGFVLDLVRTGVEFAERSNRSGGRR